MLPDILTAKNLLSFYIKRIHSTPVWTIADRIMTYSRRLLFVTRILKYAALIISIIETSAILIVTATFLLAFLPVILFVAVIFNVADDINGSRLLKKLDLRLDRDKIYVFFKTGRFGENTAREFGKESAVFIVSNVFRHRFFTAKADGDVIIINKAFFIRLRQRYFNAVPEKMQYIF